jgi:SAM-dependent methyltransferase
LGLLRHPLLVRLGRALDRVKERLVHGGPRRERVLRRLLGAHYWSLFRREWQLSGEPPHFFDHRFDAFKLLDDVGGVHPLTRAFFAAEVLREGDVVLDIGCGDGFFDRAFFADRVAHIDAIDIEQSAIEHSRRVNPAPTIAYARMDAVADPFPRERYDVVIWDGALGHFAPDTTDTMLGKIARSLAEDGVFVGSETLGTEGDDHLQWWETLDKLAEVFKRHFEHVQVREVRYPIMGGRIRREAFWRCSASAARLDALAWQDR